MVIVCQGDLKIILLGPKHAFHCQWNIGRDQPSIFLLLISSPPLSSLSILFSFLICLVFSIVFLFISYLFFVCLFLSCLFCLLLPLFLLSPHVYFLTWCIPNKKRKNITKPIGRLYS